MGRKASEINFPFEAKQKDLPVLPSQEQEREEPGEGQDKDGKKEEDREAFDWKKHLSKCIRLTRKTAKAFGASRPACSLARSLI
jgi:hypothetical protein